MPGSTLEKITEREQAVAAEADRTRTEMEQLTGRLGELEGELADLATARKVVLALEQVEDGTTLSPNMPDNPAYQHILAALGDAGTPRRARDLCRALDLGIEPKHIEGMRAKLKRLVGHGLVTETEPGLFTLHHQ
ncbi:hypothetical protein [Actinacidiphila oryziradicis]|uniref:Uncharacterized protein n=1 Tax=Actinacidiphila oryziradicis TaxID=2571141 RepID=A0A4V5MX04_9ACTN|nr:hypothetical protein [Actinacidiphila oryziradicis]TJZ97948.1 hypothetical protein FCI23_48845 [Actinacidiphila oryziradicis]